MNIVFWLLVVVALVFCWFLLSFCFGGFGQWLSDLFNHAKEQITEDENEEE